MRRLCLTHDTAHVVHCTCTVPGDCCARQPISVLQAHIHAPFQLTILIFARCSRRIVEHGEHGIAVAPTYVEYARALLAKAQAEGDPFGGALSSDKDKAGGGQDASAAEEGGDDDEDADEDEEEAEADDLELSFQCFEVARMIYESNPGHEMELADVLEHLSEVAMENETWGQAIADLTGALKIKAGLLAPDDRQVRHSRRAPSQLADLAGPADRTYRHRLIESPATIAPRSWRTSTTSSPRLRRHSCRMRSSGRTSRRKLPRPLPPPPSPPPPRRLRCRRMAHTHGCHTRTPHSHATLRTPRSHASLACLQHLPPIPSVRCRRHRRPRIRILSSHGATRHPPPRSRPPRSRPPRSRAVSRDARAVPTLAGAKSRPPPSTARPHRCSRRVSPPCAALGHSLPRRRPRNWASFSPTCRCPPPAITRGRRLPRRASCRLA